MSSTIFFAICRRDFFTVAEAADLTQIDPLSQVANLHNQSRPSAQERTRLHYKINMNPSVTTVYAKICRPKRTGAVTSYRAN
jgi:hypothetical protein